MSFLTLGALLIAFFVAAPVAAHLLRRRRAEEKPFPAAHLVPASPPLARRRSALEDRALFSIRTLAVVGLALLGATPFIHCSRLSLNRKSGASVALAIVLDDSLSMRARVDPQGQKTRFDRALEAARQLTQGLESGDAVAVVLAGSPARVALGSTTNIGAVTGTLDALEASDRATDLDGAVHLAKGLVRGLAQKDKRVVLLSDLADGSPDAPPLAGDDDIALWTPVPELAAGGDDCGLTRADRANGKIIAHVVCAHDGAPLAGKADDAPAPSASAPASASATGTGDPSRGRTVEVRAGDKVVASMALPAGLRAEDLSIPLPADAPESLYARLTGSDLLPEDDEAPVAAAGGALSVAVVVDTATSHVATGGPPPIEQAFAALALDAQVRPLPTVPEQEAELSAFSALIVDDAPGFTPEVRRALGAWIDRGGVALLTLGPRAAAAPLGASFDPLIPGVVRWGASPSEGIDVESAASLGPSVEGLAKLTPHGRTALDASAVDGAEVIARWSDGAPFLIRRTLGRGAVFALTLPLNADESDLVLRPAFLALLDRLVSNARGRGGARRIEVGETWSFDGFRSVRVAHVAFGGAKKERPLTLTEASGHPQATPSLAGLYELDLDGAASTRVAAVADREVSLRPRRVHDDSRTAQLGGMASSLDVSPYVALGLLALLLAELAVRTVTQRRDVAAARAAGAGSGPTSTRGAGLV